MGKRLLLICLTRLSKYSIEVRRRRKSFDDDGGYAEKIPSSVRYEPLSRTVFCELDWVPNTCSPSTAQARELRQNGATGKLRMTPMCQLPAGRQAIGRRFRRNSGRDLRAIASADRGALIRLTSV
jgi:hypothetical protein